MSKVRILALFLASTMLLAACGDDDDDGAPPSEALLRVVHGSPDAPEVDVLLNDSIVLMDVPYLGQSGYLVVAAGPANIKVNVAGTDMTVIDADVVLDADTAYTVAAVNQVANIEALVLVDDLEPPADGQARVRLIHGAPSAPEVDIFFGAPDAALGDPLLEDVPYLAVADGNVVDAGTYRVRIAPAGTTDIVIDTGAIPLESGVAYTAIAVDAAGGGAPFGALLLVDQSPAG